MNKILKLAYPYKDKLQQKYNEIILNEKYKYYNCNHWWKYELKIESDNWQTLQCISTDKENNIIGFIEADIDRNIESVSSLQIINFYDINITFSRDLYEFLINLFKKYKFKKINFCVICGNPIENMYDKYINKYGGRIVGVKKEHVKLHDGEICDLKMYEIFKRDFDRCYFK